MSLFSSNPCKAPKHQSMEIRGLTSFGARVGRGSGRVLKVRVQGSGYMWGLEYTSGSGTGEVEG